jgi:hypothetical protein
MGWGAAIHAAKLEDRIKLLEDELSLYREKYGFIRFINVGDSGYSGQNIHPERNHECTCKMKTGESGYSYMHMELKDVKD